MTPQKALHSFVQLTHGSWAGWPGGKTFARGCVQFCAINPRVMGWLAWW